MLRTRSLATLITAAVFASATLAAHADTSDGSQTVQSGGMSMAAGVLLSTEAIPLKGSVAAPVGSAIGAAFVVTGVLMVGTDLAKVSITKAADGSKAVIAVSADVIHKTGVVAGSAVQAVSEVTGYSLIASGQLLAFIPNQAGMSLLQHSRISSAASAPASSK